MLHCHVHCTRQRHRIFRWEKSEDERSRRLPCLKQTPSTPGWTLGPGTAAREVPGVGCCVLPGAGGGGQKGRRSGGRGGWQQQRGTAMGRKNKKGPGGREGRLVVTFDEERRR